MLIKISKVVDKTVIFDKNIIIDKNIIFDKNINIDKNINVDENINLKIFFTQLAFPLLGEVPLELQGEGLRGGLAGFSI